MISGGQWRELNAYGGHQRSRKRHLFSKFGSANSVCKNFPGMSYSDACFLGVRLSYVRYAVRGFVRQLQGLGCEANGMIDRLLCYKNDNFI